MASALDVLVVTDEEILADLMQYKPIDSSWERNIWAFWDQGLAAMKPWCQRNVISWVRRHGPRWTVRVLDMVPDSPNHYSKFIPNTSVYFPEAFLQQAMTGSHKAPHAADLIRLPLIFLHGGAWVDVGFMLFRDLDDLCWNKMVEEPISPGSELELAGFVMPVKEGLNMMWNGFISSRKGSKIVKFWQDTFLELWEGRDSTQGMHAHALLQHLPRYEIPPPPDEDPVFKYGEFVDYLIHMYCLERVRNMVDPAQEWSGQTYFHQHTYMLDVVREVYWAQALTAWDGKKQFELLNRQREGENQSNEEWVESEAFLSGILSTSSTMKLGHGIATDVREYLARIWDLPENSEADRKPGTFAARLRWASVHYHQTKGLERIYLAVRPDATLMGDLLSAVGEPHVEVYPDGR